MLPLFTSPAVILAFAASSSVVSLRSCTWTVHVCLQEFGRVPALELWPLRCDELRERLQLGDKEMWKVVKMVPQALSLDFEAIAHVRLDMLQQRVGLSNAELSKVVTRLPAVLGSTEQAMASKLDALQQRLRLSEKELRSVVVRMPRG